MVGMTKSGSLIGANGTKETPSGKSSRSSVATWSARRVLPTPPVPVRVKRRTSGRCRRVQAAATSCLRPMREVSCAGRLCIGACQASVDCCEVRMGGVWSEKASGRQAACRARAKSCTLPKRCLGSLAKALSTTFSTLTGMVETRSRKGGGGRLKCWTINSLIEPWKGGFPQSHS